MSFARFLSDALGFPLGLDWALKRTFLPGRIVLPRVYWSQRLRLLVGLAVRVAHPDQDDFQRLSFGPSLDDFTLLFCLGRLD